MSKRNYTINTAAIEAAMHHNWMSQAELAKKTGLSPATISNILAGKFGNIKSLHSVAKALHMKRDDITTIASPQE